MQERWAEQHCLALQPIFERFDQEWRARQDEPKIIIQAQSYLAQNPTFDSHFALISKVDPAP